MPKCKGCGREIIWIGKMPCEPERIVYQQDNHGEYRVVTPNGEVLRARMPENPQTATGVGYISHFATCPQADRFRRKR